MDKQDKLLQATNQEGEQTWDILNEDIRKLHADHSASILGIWKNSNKRFIPVSRTLQIPKETSGNASVLWRLLSLNCLPNLTNESHKVGSQKSLSLKLCPTLKLFLRFFPTLYYCNQPVGMLWIPRSILKENLAQLRSNVNLSKPAVAVLPELI